MVYANVAVIWFHEILCHMTKAQYVEIYKFFPHDFLQKFRQMNFFTIELYC